MNAKTTEEKMKHHETEALCEFCNGPMSLTTERGWIDSDTVTAVLCCPECRTESDHADDTVFIAHASSEREALAALEE